jgi:hypothetical protein
MKGKQSKTRSFCFPDAFATDTSDSSLSLSSFYRNQRFTTTFTRACRWSLSRIKRIQYIPTTVLRNIDSNISSYSRLGLPRYLFPSVFPTKFLCISQVSHACYMPVHLIMLDLITLTIYAAPPASKYFLPLRPKVYPSALLSDTSNILPLT